jgi:glycosyltransferase involved in cell wall biosynthesis
LCHRNADPEEARQAAAYLHKQGIKTVLVERQRPLRTGALGKLQFCSRIARNLFSPEPFSAQWNKCPRLWEAVARHAATEKVDLWQCEWAPYATALLPLQKARWIMMAHDIQSLIWQRYYQNATNPLKRWYIKLQAERYQRYEQTVFSQAPLTISVTAEDAKRARELFGARRTAVVDNGVAVAHYQAADCQQGSTRCPNEILFLGNLEWRANLDACRLLLDEVFPRVVALEPSARLCIVGRRPPKWLRERGDLTRNVEVHADVADVRPYLYRCGAMAVPLRIGGGSRLKILEALACGLPVASTGVGAEGLRLTPGVHYARTETAEEMAKTLVDWLRDPAPAKTQAEAGQRLVEREYDWSVLACKMEQAWTNLLHDSLSPALAVQS